MDPLEKGFDMKLGQMNYLDKIAPRFHMRAVYMEEESEKAGHAVYKDFAYVEMITPGDRRTIPCMRVREEHKKQWPKQWAAFEAGCEYVEDGRPLAEWAVMPGSMVKMLQAIGIKTVEQLAQVNVDAIKGLGPGFVKMREAAIKFIAENDTKQEQIDDLKKQNEDLLERIRAIEESTRSKVNEPKKTTPKIAPKSAPKPKEKKDENSSGDSE